MTTCARSWPSATVLAGASVWAAGELDVVYGDWRDRVAHRRRHATGQFIVVDRLVQECATLRALPPGAFDFSLNRTVRVPTDGHLCHGACFYRAPVELIHQRVELHAAAMRCGSAGAGMRWCATRAATGRGCGSPNRECVRTTPAGRPAQLSVIEQPELSDYAELRA